MVDAAAAARRSEAKVPRLVIHQLDHDDRSLSLHGEGYRLGRDEQLEIPLVHRAISRLHAVLQRRGRRWMLIDQGSTNGLWWSGRRIRELELQDGDRIALAPASEPGAPTLEFLDPRQRRSRRLAIAAGGLLATALTAGGILLLLANVSVPVRGRLATVQGPIAIYDRKNQPIKSVDSQRHRELATLRDFSPTLINALLASEDNRFWWHPGIDAIGTVRALFTNIFGGEVLEGQQPDPAAGPKPVPRPGGSGRHARTQVARTSGGAPARKPLQQIGVAAELPQPGLPRRGIWF